jgi:heme-degrading monooxygenase HmoA
MYGRLIEVEGIDRSKREHVLQIIRERVIPDMQQMEGFAGFISLVDEENQRARSIVLWETREAADEAERQFKARREEIVRGAGGTVRSADLYEAPIVEVRTGVHA